MVLALLGIIISYTADNFFPSDYEENKSREERLKARLNIFKEQTLFLSLILALIGILISIFSDNILAIIKSKKEIFTNILVFLVVLIIFFLLLEVVLRVFYSQQIYDEFGFGPGEPYHYNKIKFNSWGYRDIEHSIKKDNDTYRILIIGDSFTFGWGIKNLDDIYSRVLQKKLDNEYGKDKFEVITLAKNGFSTKDVTKVLKDIGLNLNPDLIVYGYYVNDIEGANSFKGYEKLYFHHFLRPYEVGYFLYQNSFAYYFLESRIKNMIRSYGLERNTYKNYMEHLYSDSNPSFIEHRQSMQEFINIGTERNIPIIVLSFPIITDFEDYPFYFINEYIESITKDVVYIDLLNSFSDYSPEELRVGFLEEHINELGHSITANILFNEIKTMEVHNIYP